MLNTVTRGEFNWTGFIISDETAVSGIALTHHFAGSPLGAAVDAMNGGCDMELDNTAQDSVFPNLIQAVQSGRVNRSTVTRAATRILTQRFVVGDLDPPELDPYSLLNESNIFAPESLAVSYVNML